MTRPRILLPALLLLAALPACGTIAGVFHPGDELTWAQVQAIRPGMTAREVLRIFGQPNEKRLDDGRISRLTYLCWNEEEKELRTADLEFDREEVLVKKSIW